MLATMQPLLSQCRETTPTDIELSALAAALHSFYTGVENIFKRVALELDAQPPQGESWHRDRKEQRRDNGAEEKPSQSGGIQQGASSPARADL